MQPVPFRWRRDLASLSRVCLDSNAIIYFLQGDEPHATLVADVIDRLGDGALEATISTITELELFVAPLRLRDRRALDRIELFVRGTPNMSVLAVDRVIARRAAEVRAHTRLLAPDAIIAATAMEARCDAIVGNDVTFSRRFTQLPYLLLNDYIP